MFKSPKSDELSFAAFHSKCLNRLRLFEIKKKRFLSENFIWVPMLHYPYITIQWNKMRTCIRFHVYSTRPIFSNLRYLWHVGDAVVYDLLPIYRLHYDKQFVEAQFWIFDPNFVAILRYVGSIWDELLLGSCCVEHCKIDVLSRMFHVLKKRTKYNIHFRSLIRQFLSSGSIIRYQC